MAVKGQENPGKKGLLQGMGKVWKFHFEFRENLHLWKKSGKREISSKFEVVHLVFHDERWWHFPFWCWLCTMCGTVNRFLTTISLSFIMQVKVGSWKKSYTFIFFWTFHGHERYWMSKISLCLVLKKIEEFSTHVHCMWLPESFNFWVAVWRGLMSLSGFACEIVNSIGQRNLCLSDIG